MSKTVIRRVLAFLVLICIVSAYFLTMRTQKTSKELFAMDSYMSFTVWGRGNNAVLSAETVLTLSKDFSMYTDGALLDLNQNAGKPVIVPQELFDIIEKANLLSAKYGGRVDITSGALTRLWNVSSDNPYLPTEEEAFQAAAGADYSKVELDSSAGTVFIPEGMEIDLGSVAKGYACDRLKTLYEKEKTKCAIVSMGSSSLLYGTKPDKSPFTVEIRNPDGGVPLGIVKTGEIFLSTSGGYERFFEVDGIRYTHIFDLRTGFPSETDLTSVTVLCDGGMQSDFLSTLVYLDGTAGIQKHLDAKDYKIIAATEDKRIYVSSGLDFTLNAESGYRLEGAP